MRAAVLAFSAFVLTAAAVSAQERVPATAQYEQGTVQPKIAVAVPARVPLESKIVTGAPYAAEVVSETVQALGDGNRIVRRSTGRVYRDSQGRTRREDDAEPGHPARISITDPVAGVSYSLDPATRTAWKTPSHVAGGIFRKVAPGDPAEVELRRRLEAELTFAAQAQAARGEHVTVHIPAHATVEPVIAARTVAEASAPKTEKLPARSIEGVMAEGTRTSWTVPAGAIGNEQPIVTVTEEWRSPELQVLVLTRASDPRTGESTYRLQNVVRGEQGRSWFEVPADYTVKESGIRHLAPVVK